MDEYKTYQVPTSEPIIYPILAIIGLALLADFAGLVFWAMSEQTPVDGFYLGAISEKIISLFM